MSCLFYRFDRTQQKILWSTCLAWVWRSFFCVPWILFSDNFRVIQPLSTVVYFFVHVSPVCMNVKEDLHRFNSERNVIMTKHFQQWMSWLPYRWRTQRNAIRNANCKIQWVIKTLNTTCTSFGSMSIGVFVFPHHEYVSRRLLMLSKGIAAYLAILHSLEDEACYLYTNISCGT